ncbi:beta-galactosidase GalA [Plebeiibacterium sediminum]|uniref:DUF4982 domain-containing protein n=1 Tax=Plebeiibacterium sediminum TaxID=2992112 RepID=A0AAE3M944_9BACT|nr:beta-galactosidase GalA [Plebeiobacterium sediminum]MCW3789521.1 DUF4982 domain-containing protein [Plebeiobacterium sediminum]
MKKLLIVFILTCLTNYGFAQMSRSNVCFDKGWFFAFGHPFDKTQDYNTGTGYFSYMAKAGYGDGAASKDFDHRAWRPIDLPHDWAVEMPFDSKGSHSHGYKAVGPGFPDVSVGWYRKTFVVTREDKGKQIFLDFDGVSRDAKVWVNGHYMGNEPSGYQSFSYNITDVINYGGENVVAVRADVSMEEGWYYEGAGIYRHVWLRKTLPLHIPKDGTFIYSELDGNKAKLVIETEIENRGLKTSAYSIRHYILNKDSLIIDSLISHDAFISAMSKNLQKDSLSLNNPILWSLNHPYLYTLKTQIKEGDRIIDEYQTSFGIRTVYFDANKGFFLNGKHIKLKGTNNHQDHAGVGCAIPDELIKWRLQQLKNFGCNAYRSSHNPPTPELLKYCDEMGILVIDENRLMGTTDHALHEMKRVIKRDRNHPSVIIWSLGNEEWGIECNVLGEQITPTMQRFAQNLDPSRQINVAISGGCNNGTSSVVEVVGYNYLGQWDTDRHHQLFPNQPSIGTEEGSTYATRGIYFDDDEKHYKAAYDREPRANWYSIEEGWKHYAERDYLSGMFIWTGFDYRGEPTPYAWPSVTSYFGMIDLCGFPKDNVYYLKSWWQDEPVLHILPHWNWNGKEGDTIDVWVYSNAQEVELKLKGKTLGRKVMELNGHLEWKVPYKKGTIKAYSFKDGKLIQTTERSTTGMPDEISLSASKTTLSAKSNDISVLTVEVKDKKGNVVPTVNNIISFELDGPGKIIGVGNGNPTSLEKEKFVDDYKLITLPEVAEIYEEGEKVLTTSFQLEELPTEHQLLTWYYKYVSEKQNIYINGVLITQDLLKSSEKAQFALNNDWLRVGTNTITIEGKPLMPVNAWTSINKQPGVIQILNKASNWERKLYNGKAQVIIQSDAEPGEILLKARAEGIKSKDILINVE